MTFRLLSFFILIVMSTSMAWGHQASDSYLSLKINNTSATGKWDIAFRDLEVLIDLDLNADGAITRGELLSQSNMLLDVVADKISLTKTGQGCQIQFTKQTPFLKDEEPYLTFHFSVNCGPLGAPDTLIYNFLFETDLSHQSLFQVTRDSETVTGFISSDRRTIMLGSASSFSSFLTFLESGLVHIVEGPDHILFLLVLLIAITAFGVKSNFSNKQIVIETVKLLTAFTVAHAVTLGLAQTGVISLPAWFVESIIGLSVLVAAVDVFVPILGKRKWQAALGFGLIHGLGFAGALGPLNMPGIELLVALLAFNLGIEFGQLFLASFTLLILLVVLRRDQLKLATGRWLAAVFGLVGCYWFLDRSIGL